MTLPPDVTRVLCEFVNDKYTELNNKHNALLQNFAEEVAEKRRYKDEAERYKGLYESLSKKAPVELPFNYFLDTRMWMNPKTKMHPTTQQLMNFCDQLYTLSTKQYSNGSHYIYQSKFLSPLHQVLTNEESLPFNFCGTLDDFAYYWNSNIYERQLLNNCEIKIECIAETLSTNKNRPPWKGVCHTSWKHLALLGGKDASIYDQANDILKEIKTFSF